MSPPRFCVRIGIYAVSTRQGAVHNKLSSRCFIWERVCVAQRKWRTRAKCMIIPFDAESVKRRVPSADRNARHP